jgi:uncharacterized protein (TIRG00374 family)
MVKPKVKRLFQVAVTVGLIFYVCYSAGVFSKSGRDEFAAVISQVDWGIVGLSIFITFVQNLVSVWKWKLVVVAKHLKAGFLVLLNYLFVSRLYNLILPSSMGGDVIRIYRLGKLNANMEVAAASVFVERFVGMLVLLALSCISLVFMVHGGGMLFFLSFTFLLLVTFMLGWAAVDARFVGILQALADKTDLAILLKISGKFEAFQASIREVGRNKIFLIKLFFYSVLFYVLAILSVWISALAFDQSVSLVDMVIAVPFIMLIMNLPVSIGGLGLMEASYTVAFEILGYSAELGLITALLMRGKALLDALVGGVIELGNA